MRIRGGEGRASRWRVNAWPKEPAPPVMRTQGLSGCGGRSVVKSNLYRLPEEFGFERDTEALADVGVGQVTVVDELLEDAVCAVLAELGDEAGERDRAVA